MDRTTFWRRAGALLLLTVLVAATAATASAAPMKSLSLTPGPLLGIYGLERPVATGAGNQHYPSIYGDLVAYEDSVPDADVKLYNAKTNATYPVSVHAGSRQWRPRIWGNRIVWLDDRNGSNWDIWWYDIAAKTEHRLTTSSGNELWPEINGDRVVWQDDRDGNWNVFMYDFKTRVTTRVTTHAAEQAAPRISGNRIIWQDYRNGNWDIYWYDIAKRQEYQLTTSANAEYEPDIWGTRAAWTVNNGANLDMYVASYFDASGVAFSWASGTGNQFRPRLHGDTLVYTDDSSGNPLVLLFRTGAPGVYQLTTSAGTKYEPQFWNDTAVWFDGRAGNSDVYAMTIPSPELGLFANSTVGYGKSATVAGYLVNWDGTPLSNRQIQIQYLLHKDLTASFWWAVAGTVKTNSQGVFVATVPAQYTRFSVRAFFDGDPDAFRQVSSHKTVVPKVSLSKPAGKSTVSNTKSYTYYGYLKPKHTAGTQRVWIKCYRKVGSKYVLKKTYTTTLSDYSTYTKYSRSIKLSTEGKWRIRAYYKATLNNATSYSSWKYVTSN